MSNSELEQTQLEISAARDTLKTYLVNSYYKSAEESSKCAEKTFKYLERIVDSIIKRDAYHINFDKGGCPLWHATVLSLLAAWIKAEYKISYLLSKELDLLD